MDSSTEKKWFVYLGDRHEGPMTEAELREKVSQTAGAAAGDSYVWCQGMADWQQMKAVPALAAAPATSAPEPTQPSTPDGATQISLQAPVLEPAAPLEAAPTLEPLQPMEAAQPAEVLQPLTPIEATPTPLEEIPQEVQPMEPMAPETPNPTPAAPAEAAPTDAAPAQPPRLQRLKERLRSVLRPKVLLLLLLLGLGGAVAQGVRTGMFTDLVTPETLNKTREKAEKWLRPVMIALSEKVPALKKWISPIPSLDDVTAEDYNLLRQAASADLKEAGPTVAVALSYADPQLPHAYVATNLPDGAAFEIYIEGIPETLLNQLSFSTRVSLQVTGLMGKTAPIALPDGAPVPRGEYVFHVVDAEQQTQPIQQILSGAKVPDARLPESVPKGRKLVATKSYFLGGKKDAVYASRLDAFHEKIRERAKSEVAELRQFAMTLISQFNLSAATYASLKKNKNLAGRKNSWTSFHGKWAKLDAQLAETFAKWDPETLKNGYFHAKLYQMTHDAGLAVTKMHELHNAFFTKKIEPKSFDIELGEATSSAQLALSNLKAKVMEAEQGLPVDKGLPKRVE